MAAAMRSATRPTIAVFLAFALGAVFAAPAGAAVATVGSCAIKQSTSCVGADLRGADLTRADLRHADLRNANLTGANLEKANLAGANLQGAKLVRVRAEGVNLSSVLMQGADLAEGEFTAANLDGSQLDAVNLTRANLNRIHAHATNFAHAEMNNAKVVAADLKGSNFFGAHVHGTQFSTTSIAATNWTGAYFFQTNFLGAHDVGTAKLTPSTVGSDDVARFYLFDRVYAHVNAYHSYGSCSDHSGGAISCSGQNDDPAATYGFDGSNKTSFGWGYSNENPRSFFIIGGRGVTFRGTTNSNFGTFSITQIENFPGVPTAHDAGAGEVGGPLALHLGHHGASGWNIFDPSGYHLNFRGWVQRSGTAPTISPR